MNRATLRAVRPAWFLRETETQVAWCHSNSTQHDVGRERNQRVCYRQLVRSAVVHRRVNSTFGASPEMNLKLKLLLFLITPLLVFSVSGVTLFAQDSALPKKETLRG